MKRSLVLLTLLLVTITTTSFTAYAQNVVDSNMPSDSSAGTVAPLPTTGQYHGIAWSGLTPVTGLAFGIFPGVNPPWTMDCGAGSCLFTVVDGFVPIDQFEVFDFGGSIGITSVPNTGGASCGGTDPDACLANPDFSSGVFCLGSGTHSITMDQILNTGGGAAWIKSTLQSSLCAVGGMSIPLDSTALLLAGAQTTSAWLIPVIVVAIGFAIVIARKL